MTGPQYNLESTSEPSSGPSRPPAPASTEGSPDDRTPAERLLARRRLGKAYLDDVRSLIARAEDAEAMLAHYLSHRIDGQASNAANSGGVFGTVRTITLPDE